MENKTIDELIDLAEELVGDDSDELTELIFDYNSAHEIISIVRYKLIKIIKENKEK